MKILYAASEARPFAASGGLADVAGSLPKALKKEGCECRVVLPLYDGILSRFGDRIHYEKYFYVDLAYRHQYCGLFKAEENGVTYYFIDNEYYFKRGGLYGYEDDGERFAFFAKAVLEMLVTLDYCPDIIHCNDWQTAMLPVFLNVFYRGVKKLNGVRTVFTIHNIQYQGKMDMFVADDVCGLPGFGKGMVEFDGCMNMMKGAFEETDLITTVSPSYAEEIQTGEYGFGLDGFLRHKSYKLCGILNGIDTDSYNPLTDKDIAKHYSVKSAGNKQANKKALQTELGLEVTDEKPIIGIVSRLVGAKGTDMIRFVFEDILSYGFQVAIIGTGDKTYEDFFEDAARRHQGTVAYVRGFVPAVSRKIYAGSDFFLMPSRSEPCGLSQMIALRYGTIPIVRRTGGLKDSIVDLSLEGGNGFTFDGYNVAEMMNGIRRAHELYEDKPRMKQAVVTALACDFSWDVSARAYIDMYKRVLSL